VALTFPQQFKAARNAATPIVAVRTVDAAATMQVIAAALNGSKTPLMVWDILHGVRGINGPGSAKIPEIFRDAEPEAVANPPETLKILEQAARDLGNDTFVAEGSVIFFLNAHKYLTEISVIQGVWNLRDPFKAASIVLVLMMPPGTILPWELSDDVTVLDHPLPTREEIMATLDATYTSYSNAMTAKKKTVPKWNREKCADALVGLSAFSAEQSFSMCLDLDGAPIDMQELWERKRKTIEQTRGLKVYRGDEKFADLGGIKTIKEYMNSALKGRDEIRCVLWLDELADVMSGVGSDTSGVKTELHGMLLKWMQERNITGFILTGAPGAGKSAISKAFANEAQVPCIEFELSDMQGSLVGQSQANLRAALNIVDAMSQDKVIVMATCNTMEGLSPQLISRFRHGVWFFDLPDAEESEPIWSIWRKKYEIDPKDVAPPSTGWTGREIAQCCYLAWNLRKKLKDVAQFVVATADSGREQLDRSRSQAVGRYLSASYPGKYKLPSTAQTAPSGGGRRFGPTSIDQKGGTA
jgi:hypothetical protein